jgi:geranylgeranyl diphosphate synthase type I
LESLKSGRHLDGYELVSRGVSNMSKLEQMWNAEVDRINQALEEFLTMKRDAAHYLGATHDQYYDNIKEYILRGGKRLRPLAVIAAYKAVKDTVENQYLYRAACSFEILHNGSLIHDDQIDHDETRRGGPTFHARYRDWLIENFRAKKERADDFGMTMAFLGGDSLINLGAEAITKSELSPEIGMECHKYYQMGFSEIVEGVLLEMMMVMNPDVDPETYLEMIRLKTAALFEKALLMGAAIAGASDSQLKAFSEYGIKVGQAFQMQDDILGSFGDEEKTGKSASGDIREGKKTMLLIQSLRMANDNQRRTLEELLGRHDLTDEEVDKVRTIFKETGAFDATQTLMNELLTAGQDALKNTVPPLKSEYLEFLLALSEFLTSRAF